MSCLTFVNLASIHSICFTLKLWANSWPCFKASPWDWETVESRSFTFFNVPFNFSTIPLCLFDGQVQFSSITGRMGFSWYPGMEKSLALFEQPSELKKVASFVCTLFFPNTSYLVQYHNAGERKDSVPGHCYFGKIEKFTNEHNEEGENYRESVKFSCQEKVGEICSVCCEWTGPPIERGLKPIPDHSCLLESATTSPTRKPQKKSVISCSKTPSLKKA